MTITEPGVRRTGRTSTWEVAEALKLRQQVKPGTNPPRNWTNADLAELYGVSKQAIGKRLNEATNGATKGGAIPSTRLLPWRVAKHHDDTYMVTMLRLIVKRNRGDKLSPDDNSMVDNFLAKLREMGPDLVVDYDRDQHIGFFFRPKTDADELIHGFMVTNDVGYK